MSEILGSSFHKPDPRKSANFKETAVCLEARKKRDRQASCRR